ncbi:RalA-binding protein [Trichinella spiralis]|uniref:RalA-binding protein n=1 Tax=Trichinella spiralis TaxID=6334 RepID=A0ABR3K962_TRISP
MAELGGAGGSLASPLSAYTSFTPVSGQACILGHAQMPSVGRFLFSQLDRLFSPWALCQTVYISPLRPASGKSLPTDPKAILEELAKQEFLLSHLHDEINSGINDPQKEEQLWDVQRLVTQLKRELKSLKKKNINAFNEVEQESGPCIEMFEEKQLLAVHMDLRNKIEIQRAQIEDSAFSDAELSQEKKFDPKWPEQYSALEDRKRELIESIVSERQKCVRLLAEMEMLAVAKDNDSNLSLSPTGFLVCS